MNRGARLVSGAFVAIFAIVLMTACLPFVAKDSNGIKWRHLKSPVTARCYEVASLVDVIYGMAEIPCSEAKLGADPQNLR